MEDKDTYEYLDVEVGDLAIYENGQASRITKLYPEQKMFSTGSDRWTDERTFYYMKDGKCTDGRLTNVFTVVKPRYLGYDLRTPSETSKNEAVRAIVRQYLVEHGYDGLCNPSLPCGCGKDDLAPCEFLSLDECVVAYKSLCKNCVLSGYCSTHDEELYDNGNGHCYHIWDDAQKILRELENEEN